MGTVTSWFVPSERGTRAFGKKAFILTITEKPRGIRFNAPMSRSLARNDTRFVEIGISEDMNTLTIKPVNSRTTQAFSLAGNKHAMQANAAELYHWAIQHDLIGKRIAGEYKEEDGIYEFNLKEEANEHDDDDDESEEEVEK